jgi:hypothetical protein
MHYQRVFAKQQVIFPCIADSGAFLGGCIYSASGFFPDCGVAGHFFLAKARLARICA